MTNLTMGWKLGELYGRFRDRVEEEGFRRGSKTAAISVTKRVCRSLYQPPSIYLHSRFADRWNVFNEEWDLLIILDTCRPDALRQVSDEFPFIGEVDTRWSVGASSSEWIYNTFDKKYREEIRQTAYISSNPYSWTVLEKNFETDRHGGELRPTRRRLKRYTVTSPVSSDEFHTYICPWSPSDNYGPVTYPSPRSLTDHLIDLDRGEDPPPRVIIHYMPPHIPYIARSVDGNIEFTDEPRPKTSFEAYIDNLRWALNEVSLLLENVDREKVVITADHGENFRLRSIRESHIAGMITPAVRRVPWVQTTASDERTYEPELPGEDERESITPEETLEALGYLT